MKRKLLAALIALASTAPAIAEESQAETSKPAEQTAAAADQAAADQTAAAAEQGASGDPTPTAETSSEGGTVIRGGVKGTALRTEEGMVSIEQSAKMVQNDVLEVMKECTRKETVVVRGPNYIGNGIVIPALGGDPTGVARVGDLPARKDKLLRFIASSEDAFNVLQNHMDALILPDPPPEELANIWAGMRTTVAAARQNLDSLKELANQPKFDKKQVGRHALKVYDGMTALEKMRAQVHTMLFPGKEGKE